MSLIHRLSATNKIKYLLSGNQRKQWLLAFYRCHFRVSKITIVRNDLFESVSQNSSLWIPDTPGCSMSSENYWPHLLFLDLCKFLANNWQNDCQSVSFCMDYGSHVYGSVISMSGSCFAYLRPVLLSQQIQLVSVVEFVRNSLTWLSGTGRCRILGHLFFLSRRQVLDLLTCFFAGFQRDVCYADPPKWQVITFMVFNWPQKMTKQVQTWEEGTKMSPSEKNSCKRRLQRIWVEEFWIVGDYMLVRISS